MKRETLAIALLFSVPPAVGMTGFLTVLWGGGPVSLPGAGVGALLGGALFLLIVKAAAGPEDGAEAEG